RRHALNLVVVLEVVERRRVDPGHLLRERVQVHIDLGVAGVGVGHVVASSVFLNVVLVVGGRRVIDQVLGAVAGSLVGVGGAAAGAVRERLVAGAGAGVTLHREVAHLGVLAAKLGRRLVLDVGGQRGRGGGSDRVPGGLARGVGGQLADEQVTAIL